MTFFSSFFCPVFVRREPASFEGRKMKVSETDYYVISVC